MKTGFIPISLNWKDPKEGAEIVNNFINYSNNFIAEFEKNELQL